MIDPNLLRNNLAEAAEKLQVKRGFVLDVESVKKLEEERKPTNKNGNFTSRA